MSPRGSVPQTTDRPSTNAAEDRGGAVAVGSTGGLTMRAKIFLAFAALATVGASGGMMSSLQLSDLARVYQAEHQELAAHEGVHEDRIALLTLLDLAKRYDADRDHALRPRIEQELAALTTSTQYCSTCHEQSAAERTFAEHLGALRKTLQRTFEAPIVTQAVGPTPLLFDVERSVAELESVRGSMEERYHELLELRTERGKNILTPGLWHHALLVLGGFLLALTLSWLAARTISRPMLSMIAAARRISSGVVGQPADVPADPDLAQVARALNEMTALVASQAREEARRQLLDRTIASQEDERRRIARELHDDVAQSLSALLMEVRAWKASYALGSAQAKELDARLCRLIDGVYRMARDLRPSLLDDLGLVAALSRHIEEMVRRHELAIDFQTVGFHRDSERLPSSLETALYRVAQEALNNVAHHARARRASVVVIRREREVVLLVEDDGTGFDVEAKRQRSEALGLLGMEERITLCGGTLTIEAGPERGTTVRAGVPLPGGAP